MWIIHTPKKKRKKKKKEYKSILPGAVVKVVSMDVIFCVSILRQSYCVNDLFEELVGCN